MILLGVTGSIAAYKSAEILRLLVKAGEDVQVLMTVSATHFIGPLTMQVLSNHPVITDTLDPKSWQMAHIDLAEKARAMVIAPASAESLSALARGSAADIISATVLALPRSKDGALKIPVCIAPAMHEAMWTHPATQANVVTLKAYGYRFIGPERGPLSRANDSGEGRLSDPEQIVKEVLNAASKK